MSEKSQDTEKLSFKEQILRDLAKAKGESAAQEPKPAPSEELGLDQLFKKESEPADPAMEPAATLTQEEDRVYPTVEEIMKEAENYPHDEDYNTERTPVAVSYKAEGEDIASNGIITSAPIPTRVGREQAEARKQRAEKATKKKQRQNRVAKKIVTTVFAVLVLAILATGAMGTYYVYSALQPINAKSDEFVTVEIPEGSSTKEIGSSLEKAGLIKNAQVFSLYTKFKNYAGFQSGYYNLKKSMSLDSIAKALLEGGTETPQTPALDKLVIPEGYTLEQIAQTVGDLKASKVSLSAEDFLAKVQDDAFIDQEVAKYPTLLASLPSKESGVKYRLEGYLFPATYDIKDDTTVESLIDEMISAMDKNLSGYYDSIAAQNLTVNEVLTLASLVEKEGATDQDRKSISGVFFNRLNQGMPLQSNIAILYVQGKLGQKTTLAEDAGIDTNIDSPYNVYTRQGLMPGPVDSPSLSAIEAVVNPTKSDYLYFVANTDTGVVYYANTYEEHEKNVQEHVNSKLEQAAAN